MRARNKRTYYIYYYDRLFIFWSLYKATMALVIRKFNIIILFCYLFAICLYPFVFKCVFWTIVDWKGKIPDNVTSLIQKNSFVGNRGYTFNWMKLFLLRKYLYLRLILFFWTVVLCPSKTNVNFIEENFLGVIIGLIRVGKSKIRNQYSYWVIFIWMINLRVNYHLSLILLILRFLLY